MKPTTSEYIEVRNSAIHGKGVFAACDIPKGTRIIEYVGEKISKDEAQARANVQEEIAKGNTDEGAVYIFEINDNFDLDGNVEYNTARLINHFCSPNCESEQDESDRIWIIALRDIKKGEELGYNYGYDVENWQDHPCRCGSKNCVGYIVSESQWDELEKFKNSG